MSPCLLALLLGYIMSKFPAASKPLAWLSNRLPDENSSGHSCSSPANGRKGGRHGQLSPFLLGTIACLHYEQVSSQPQAIGPAFHLTISCLLGCGLCTGVLSEVFHISWFDHVQFACAFTQSKFEPRFCEGKSLSSIIPSVSKVMKVSHSPCQEWGLKVISQ